MTLITDSTRVSTGIDDVKRLLDSLNNIVLGNPKATRLSVCCLLARGHLLIEDIPGVGKTTLAQALATLFGLSYKRIQFTSDLLPADVIGISVFNQEDQEFRFIPGPIFTSVLLADEINRATPKTQSALLEGMEERRVSVDGIPTALPEPFFVIATQNPLEQSGTFPLPESQLDRFLMRISIGYPPAETEKLLLASGSTRDKLYNAKPVVSGESLLALSNQVDEIRCSPALIEYVHNLMLATRKDAKLSCGLSPRAGLQWLQAARAWALLDGRDIVIPEDIQVLAESVVAHRLESRQAVSTDEVVRSLIADTPIP
jgi:MoxR-like ATPase